MNIQKDVFVQIGATRDGLDYYLDCARERNLHSILIETPHYLSLRKDLSRRKFNTEIALENPSDIKSVVNALKGVKNNIALILPGFDCYVSTTYAVSKALEVPPYRSEVEKHFSPPNKDEQRTTLRNLAPNVSQPNFQVVSRTSKNYIDKWFGFPLVVKPINGAGGLGVHLVNNEQELIKSLELIFGLNNYNGVQFDKVIIEEYVRGTEMSIQGICFNGLPIVLSFCEKVIKVDEVKPAESIKCFREAGHVAIPGNQLPEDLYEFVKSSVAAFNYYSGPFHIDFVICNGKPFFLEMGYRLSGGAIVELVKKLTNINWAELSFSSYLKEKIPESYYLAEPRFNCMGLATVQTESALRIANSLKESGEKIDVQKINTNICEIAKQKPLSTKLSADMARHGSGMGKLWINGNSSKEVLDLIKMCQGIN